MGNLKSYACSLNALRAVRMRVVLTGVTTMRRTLFCDGRKGTVLHTPHWSLSWGLGGLTALTPAACPASVSGTSSVASKYEELECLYAAVGKVIYEGLTNYEKATNANPSQLFGEFLCGLPSSGSLDCGPCSLTAVLGEPGRRGFGADCWFGILHSVQHSCSLSPWLSPSVHLV